MRDKKKSRIRVSSGGGEKKPCGLRNSYINPFLKMLPTGEICDLYTSALLVSQHMYVYCGIFYCWMFQRNVGVSCL